VRTTLELREQPEFAPLRDIVMLDEQVGVVWPTLPIYSTSLPLARDTQRGGDNPLRSALHAADLLLTHGKLADAIALLQHLITKLEGANPPTQGRDRRPELYTTLLTSDGALPHP
jgi:hypothetical protein